MKNAFYFALKARFVLKVLIFLSRLIDHVQEWLDLNDKVNFKIYDVTTWETNNYFPISQEVKAIRKCMRKVFLEKSYTEFGGETIPRPCSKKSKLSISLDQ